MTMTVPPKINEINIVVLNTFIIDIENEGLRIGFKYGYRDGSNNITTFKNGNIELYETKYNQLLNATPPGNKTLKQWLRPLVYAEIADYLGVPVGSID